MGLTTWSPDPKGSRSAETGPGKASEQRHRGCETCAKRGRVNQAGKPCYQQGQHRYHECRLCLVCNGEGWVVARGNQPGEDRYIDPAKSEGSSTRTARDEINYATLLRMQRNAAIRAGEEGAGDQWTRMIEARDRLSEQGSFAELLAALEQLRLGDRNEQLAYSLLLRLRVYGDVLEQERLPVVRQALGEALEILAARMPETIKVPGFLRPPDERVKKASLWRGKTDGHERQRGERDQSILDGLAAGVARATVAAQWGLSPQRVSQIAATATGP
jgi:hypothetical protein